MLNIILYLIFIEKGEVVSNDECSNKKEVP